MAKARKVAIACLRTELGFLGGKGGQQSLRAWKEEPGSTVLKQRLFSFVSTAHMCLSMCVLTRVHATVRVRG